MPKYKPGSQKSERSLPRRTLDYIEHGALEGHRNDELLQAAAQFRDNEYTQEEAENHLITRALDDGLDESEAKSAIRSAYKRSPRKAIGDGDAPNGKIFKVKKEDPGFFVDPLSDVAPVELPRHIDNGFEALLKTAFKDGEFIGIAEARPIPGKRPIPDSGVTFTADNWIEYARKRGGIENYGSGAGVFVRVNPMISGGDSDHQVTSFRHCLVEFDTVSKEDQYGAILASKLPITAVIDSGTANGENGKSIHAWVRVDAKNRKEFDERVQTVYSLFSNYNPDTQNSNPSRYSRLPDASRFGGHQRLLRINIGAKSWDEWAIEHEQDGLPLIESAEDFLRSEIPEPDILIDGVLHKGGKLVLGGPSKSRKTWVMCDLAFSVARGEEWLGIKCKQGNVLYINFELSRFAFQKRLLWIEEAKQLKDRSKLEFWNLRGFSADIALLVDKICRRVSRKSYDFIIIDPIYKCLGDRDENSAGQMTELLNHIERLSETTKAAIAIAAHFPKGNMGARESMDRIAGSGVFARDPDAVITMSPHQNPKGDETVRFDIEFNVRNFPEKDSFVVCWSPPTMKRDVVKPRVKGSAGAEVKYEFSDMLKYRDGDIGVKEWQKRCTDETGISRSQFFSLKKEFESR